jgi:hypothetical protein
MKTILFFTCFLLAGSLFARTEFESYTWNTLPAAYQTDTIKSVDGTLVQLERRITELYLNNENTFEEIFVLHKKIRVETHQAVDEQNKIYVPMHNVLNIIKIEARFIAPGGKVTNLTQESIREVENLENKGNFKTFAIEGAEVGGQIEYIYILRRKLNPYGTVYMQEAIPKGDVTVIFSYPSKLSFMAKSYNGLPAFQTTTTEGGTTYLKASAAYIPALRSEQYAAYKANLMRYEFTMTYNTYNGALRVYSWTKACNNLYDNVYQIKKNEESAVRSYVKKMNLPEGDPLAKVRYIENRIKSEISISEDNEQDLDIAEILKTKQCGKSDALRLFTALYRTAGVPFEIVITGTMDDQPFDPAFNGFNFMDKYLIYFPGINTYMVPDDISYRMNLVPYENQGEFALYLRPVSYSDELSTLTYDVRQIPYATHLDNTDSMFLDIRIGEDMTTLKAKSRRIYYGDVARNFQSFWEYTDNERKEELVKLIFNMGGENTVVDSYRVQNGSPADIGLHPMSWDLDLSTSSLVENAGDDIIVKIGETIGTQSELYQADERKLPIRVNVLHNYFRRIEFNIPEGYTLSDPADLEMNVEMLNNGTISCMFTSHAEISGNKLIIVSKEYYSELEYPVQRYEEFRKVINAAADFNKKTILLKKG